MTHGYNLQPVFSPSVLAEMIRPDGLSTVSVLSGESLSADLAHEVMSIQVSLNMFMPILICSLYWKLNKSDDLFTSHAN